MNRAFAVLCAAAALSAPAVAAEPDFERIVPAAVLQLAAAGQDLNAHSELRALNHQLAESRGLVGRLEAIKAKLEDAPNNAYERWIGARLDPFLEQISSFVSSLDSVRDAQDRAYHVCKDDVEESVEPACLSRLARSIRVLTDGYRPQIDAWGTDAAYFTVAETHYDRATAALGAFIADPFVAALAAARPAILLTKNDQPAYLWAATVGQADLMPNWAIYVSKTRGGNDPRLAQLPEIYQGYRVQVIDGRIVR